ncbi:MAG: hypothetical protein H7Z39_10550 [Burkholderiaceae bacterium]|nr:hypothetical protein [Burkholderiaceae bacterium]
MANLITTPRKWRNKLLMIKPEAIYGVDTVPTGAVDWIQARNMMLTPMDVDKAATNIEMPFMGNSGDILVSFWAKLSFDVAIAPSGTAGLAPKWSPLMLACGMSETVTPVTSVEYNLISENFGSVCAYMNIDGVKHRLLGMRGEVKGKMSAKGIPLLSFSFDALYFTPTSDPMPTVTRTGWMIEEGVTSANSGPCEIDGIPLSYSTFDWSLGNKISRIDLPGPQREISIDDRAPQASITVLAPPLAYFNPYTMAEFGVIVPLSSIHGSVAGKQLRTDMNVRIIGADYDKIEGITAYKLTLQPLPVAGNDEITLTCL